MTNKYVTFGLPKFSVKKTRVFPFWREYGAPKNAYKTRRILLLFFDKKMRVL